MDIPRISLEFDALFLSISRRLNRARNYRKSQHPSRRRQITRAAWSSEEDSGFRVGENIRAKMDDCFVVVARLWRVNHWPPIAILLSTLIVITREWNRHKLSNRCNYKLLARSREIREFHRSQMDSLVINFINSVIRL